MTRSALFIDGANLDQTCRSLKRTVDYRLLLEHFRSSRPLVRAYYFMAFSDDPNGSSRKRIDYLEYNGFTVIKRPVKVFTDPVTGRAHLKGNLDIEIAMYARDVAERLDEAVLFSGDGDFRVLVESLQRLAVRVQVVSSLETVPHPYIADELRRQADEFIEINKLPIFKSVDWRTTDRSMEVAAS